MARANGRDGEEEEHASVLAFVDGLKVVVSVSELMVFLDSEAGSSKNFRMRPTDLKREVEKKSVDWKGGGCGSEWAEGRREE